VDRPDLAVDVIGEVIAHLRVIEVRRYACGKPTEESQHTYERIDARRARV
jgi:hypothetical protein